MANPVWLLTIDSLDPSDVATTLRFSDDEYIDSSDNLYKKRLNSPAFITISPNDGGVLKIFSSASIGEIELNNTDGALNYLVGHAIDGRDATLSLFDGVSAVTPYFTGTCLGMREGNGNIYISLRTLKDLLDSDHPQTSYLGNNALPLGVEGVVDDIKGSVKPRCYGNVLNLTPKLVNTSKLIYHCSSRITSTISSAYDRGAALTRGADYTSVSDMETTAPSAGVFRCYQGYLRLGSAPAGTITADVSDTSNLAGNVFEAILTERSVSFDSTSKSTLNAIGSVGLFIDSTTSTTEMLNTLIKGLGCYWYYVGTTIYAKKLALAVTSSFDLHYWQIENINRKATGLGDNGLPASSVKIQCDRIQTTQNDLNNTVVSADRVARMLNEWRKAEDTSSSTLTRHPLSKSIEFDSCLRSVSDAQTVATDILNVVKNRVDWVEINSAYTVLPSLVIGGGFTVYTDPINDELGYSAGKLMTLIGYEPDIKNNTVRLEAIG